MPNWTEGDVTTNGIQLHYHRTGGDKPPLVLAHGITDNGLCWTRAAQRLQDTYDVIMVDARGHGQSGKPTGDYSSTAHAADLAGLIQALGLAAPRVMGHSMGAATATALAANYPELVGRVVLEDPPWRDNTEPAANRGAWMEEWKKRLAEEQKLPQEKIVALGRKNNPLWDESEFGPWSLAKKQVSLNVFGYRSTASWREALAQITCPVLLVTGDPERGGIINAETAADANAANPNLHLAHISGVGHNIRRENFETFMQVVERFLIA